MLACVGLWVALTGNSVWNNKDPVMLNPCMIGYMAQTKDGCTIQLPGNNNNTLYVKETCDEVKARIKTTVMDGPKG